MNLGERMKHNYENITCNYLPRRTHTVIRLDGKSFHTFTKKLSKPWDSNLLLAMNKTMIYLCENIQGAKIGYTQSDEISIVLTDFDSLETDVWFGGNIQKIVSVSASLATGYFNSLKLFDNIAFFDARVFTIPSRSEVINYLIWRQKDAIRNSIQMLAQSLYSHKKLMNKNQEMLLEMCDNLGKKWDDVAEDKNGRIYILKQEDQIKKWKFYSSIPNFWENREFIEDSIPILE